jgi:hypothetical protein
VSGQGIALDAPAGWDVRISRDQDDGLAVVHAASFPLPPAVGGFGGEAIDAMPPESVVLSLLEYEPAAAGRALFAGRAGFSALRVRDLDPAAITHSMAGRAGVQRFAVLAGRPFCAYVVVSRSARPRRLLEAANGLLGSLRVVPRGA